MTLHVQILGLFVATSLTAVATAVLGLATSPFSRWPRLLLRVLGVPFLLVGFARAFMFGASFGETGRWSCFVCQAIERRTEIAGLPVYRTADIDDEYGVAEAREFETWYRDEIGIEHEHVWTPVGCHGRGLSMIMCYGTLQGPYRWAFHESLQKTPHRAIRDHIVNRWVSASEDERYGLLEAFRIDGLETPFAEIYRGEELGESDLVARFERWLENHPKWR